MQQRTLGGGGLRVSALGLGCMGMSWLYGTPNDNEAIATIHRAIDLGVTFFDTAEVYGPFENERLLGRAIGDRRDGLVIATKFGFRITADGAVDGTDSRPEHVREVCDASLARLGIDAIDLFYQHRVDRAVPIEDTVGAMADLVAAGKVRYLGLSEVSAETLRRAHTVHPISALQSEWSLWERTIETDVLPAARALGVGIVPFSPSAAGFSPARRSGRKTTPPTTTAIVSRGCKGIITTSTCALSPPCAPSPRGRARRRPRSRSPGSFTRGPTWCRSRAQSAAPSWKRTWAPPRSPSPAKTWMPSLPRHRWAPPRGHATASG